jgi:hypothetical protein
MDRVQHYAGPDGLDPTGGGMRINTQADLGLQYDHLSDLIRNAIQMSIMLAQGMTQKNRAVRLLDLEGAKGGIALPEFKDGKWFVPDWSSPNNAKKFVIIKNLASFWFGYWYTKDGAWIGPDQDRLAPDMYTAAQQMVYITEGRLTALRKKALELIALGKEDEAIKLFSWRSTYLNLLTPEKRKNFKEPNLDRYRALCKLMINTPTVWDEVQQGRELNSSPLLNAYYQFALDNPDLPMPELASVAGKPINLGGHPMRPAATANGLIYILNELYALRGESHVGRELAVL